MKIRPVTKRKAVILLGLTILALLILDFGIRAAMLATTQWRLRDQNVLYVNQAGLFARGLVTLRLQFRDYEAAYGRLTAGPLQLVVNGRRRPPVALGDGVTWAAGLSAFFVSYRDLDRVLNPQVGVPWSDEPDVPTAWVDIGGSASYPRFPRIRLSETRSVDNVDVFPVAESFPGSFRRIGVPLPKDPGVQVPGFASAGPRLFVSFWGDPRQYSLMLFPVQYVPARRKALVAQRMDVLVQMERSGP